VRRWGGISTEKGTRSLWSLSAAWSSSDATVLAYLDVDPLARPRRGLLPLVAPLGLRAQ